VPLEQALGAAIGIKAAPGGFHRAHRVELAAGTAKAAGDSGHIRRGDGGAARLAKREECGFGLLAPDAIGPGADQALQFDDGHPRSFR
jgi:hypothetical protein